MTKNRRSKGREPWPAFYLLSTALLALALVSAVLLDYINRSKGEPSFLFSAREKKPAAVAPANRAPAEKAPAEVVAERPGKEKTPSAEARPPAQPPAARAPSGRNVRIAGEVALIMDDMGENLDALDEVVGLKEPLTISILPYSLHAQETARIAHDNHLEVLLHLPLESLSIRDTTNGAEGLITSAMSPAEIVASFEASYARVPFADGVNNHMGSKFTADSALMRTLLGPIKEKGLFFVDSRTTAQTMGYTEALQMGVPSVERNVFLDADADKRLIRSRLLELFQRAKRDGHAVGICHPFPETIKVLQSSFGLFKSYNLEVVPVSRLVHK